jgi:hypothetical protein
MTCISFPPPSILSSTRFMLTLDMICSLQLPEEARELEKELRQITKEKHEAVRSQDFEKVQSYLCGLVLLHFFA